MSRSHSVMQHEQAAPPMDMVEGFAVDKISKKLFVAGQWHANDLYRRAKPHVLYNTLRGNSIQPQNGMIMTGHFDGQSEPCHNLRCFFHFR